VIAAFFGADLRLASPEFARTVMNLKERNELAVQFGNIASEAGKVIMTIRASEVGVDLKSDGSPVTQADIKAEHLIRARLAAIMPNVMLIAEESFEANRGGPVPERFLLVDPLDGTREFLSGQNDFTVNIALIQSGQPIVGAICAPALNRVYLGGTTAFQVDLQPGGILPPLDSLTVIAARPVPESDMRAVASRSHMDPGTERFLSELPVSELRSAGSSLKFCLIARGDADVYPRLAPTMEWDTAAGHAILSAAGGCVFGLDGSPLCYGKIDAGFKNDGFIAWGRKPPH
jgi:3'(2'), 5'-bisphosphate nucleotidase